MTPTDWIPDIVIYHYNCADGFAAAWACWMRWADACTYVPASYGAPPPDVLDKHVLIVDFSYKRPELLDMASRASSIIILDHHKTAEADLAEFRRFADAPYRFTLATASSMAADLRRGAYPPVNALFDINRSGARMAWDFCHPGEEAPRLIKLVEDRDLWRFDWEDTKPFALWLAAEPFSFDRFAFVSQQLEDVRDSLKIMVEALAMQRFYDAKVAEIAGFAKRSPIDEHLPLVVSCPPMFASDVGHFLLTSQPSAPFAATYFDGPHNRMWSLRSDDDRVDVSAIAARFGGGGHRNAAGFSVPLP